MTDGNAPDLPGMALAWLDARAEPPVPELRKRMAEALVGVTAGTIPGALAEGALACLQSTISAPQERATALDLLAADALLTYALEAAAEIGAAALKEMTQAYGPNALAQLLPEQTDPRTPGDPGGGGGEVERQGEGKVEGEGKIEHKGEGEQPGMPNGPGGAGSGGGDV